MNMVELKSIFMEKRGFSTEDMNELMCFTKLIYIQNKISINEYCYLVRELEAQGAEIEYSDEHSSFIEVNN